MSDTILSMDGIHASYGNTPILRDIDLAIEDGETVGIMGRNGVGKTTLMKTAIGLLMPDEGTITYNGDEVTDLLEAIMGDIEDPIDTAVLGDLD